MLLALPLLLLPAAVRGLYDACGQTGSQSSHDAHPWAKPRYDDWWCGKHLAAVAELQAERAGNIEASVSISGGGSGAVRLVLFYGDSITAMYETSQAYAQLPYRTRGFGIGSDETKNLMWRVLNGEAPSGGVPADASVVLIGTNDISWVGSDSQGSTCTTQTPSRILDIAHELLAASAGHGHVLVLGVLPREDDAQLWSCVSNINRALAKSLPFHYQRTSLDRASLLDCGPVFLDFNGSLRWDIMPDGLHPSSEGFRLLQEQCIAPALASIVAGGATGSVAG